LKLGKILSMKRLTLAALALLYSTAVMAQSVPAVTANGSVVIATGNTYQTVLAAGTRRSLTVQNNNASDVCWLQFGIGVTAGNATKGKSITLAAGSSFTRYFPFVPSDEFEATCATSADTLYIDTQ
jgi:hypothetical protein